MKTENSHQPRVSSGWLVSQHLQPAGVGWGRTPTRREEMNLAVCASGGAEALAWLQFGSQEAPINKHTRSCLLHNLCKRKAAVEQGQANAGEIPSPLHISVVTSSLACSVAGRCLRDMWLLSNLTQNNSFLVLWASTLQSAAVTDNRTFSIPLF